MSACPLSAGASLGILSPPFRVEVPDTRFPGQEFFKKFFKPVFGEPKVGCGVDAMMPMAQNLPGNKIYVGMPEIDVSNHIGLA